MITDYRALLKKYIEHIVGYEGITYLSPGYLHSGYVEWTPEEEVELKQLHSEVGDRI